MLQKQKKMTFTQPDCLTWRVDTSDFRRVNATWIRFFLFYFLFFGGSVCDFYRQPYVTERKSRQFELSGIVSICCCIARCLKYGWKIVSSHEIEFLLSHQMTNYILPPPSPDLPSFYPNFRTQKSPLKTPLALLHSGK